MPRAHFKPSAEFPYHVSARCINQEWFRIPKEVVWEIFSDYLFFLNRAFNIRIHSFVLMDNHFHMIVSTPDANLDKAMNYFMRETSRRISKSSGRINQVYGGPYFRTLITQPKYFLCAYKYVYRNPVEAGLSLNVESYRFSTLHCILGNDYSIIPVVADDTLFDDVTTQLSWLNEPYETNDYRIQIKRALRKKEFDFGKDKDRKKFS